MAQERTTRLLTPDEAAERIGVKATTLRNWRWKGRGPRFVRFGRYARYTEEALHEWIRRHEVDPEAGGEGER